MITYYLLKGDQIVPVADVLEWARWFENSNKRVGDTLYNNTRVSTVFLGLDHRFRLPGFDDGPPIVFETMVFGNQNSPQRMERFIDKSCDRCSTYSEAIWQHTEACLDQEFPLWLCLITLAKMTMMRQYRRIIMTLENLSLWGTRT